MALKELTSLPDIKAVPTPITDKRVISPFYDIGSSGYDNPLFPLSPESLARQLAVRTPRSPKEPEVKSFEEQHKITMAIIEARTDEIRRELGIKPPPRLARTK